MGRPAAPGLTSRAADDRSAARRRRRAAPAIDSPRRQSGFTLVELVLVVALMAILAGVALPAAAPLAETRLDAAAGEVAAALRYARDESLRTGTVHGVEVDLPAQRITVFRADLASVPLAQAAVLYHPVDRQPYQFVLAARAGLDGVRIANASAPFLYADLVRRAVLVFDAAGTPLWIDTASGARTALVDGAIDLAFGARTRRVTIAEMTARVTAQ